MHSNQQNLEKAQLALRDWTGQDQALASDLKNRILLENHFLPGDLEAQIEAFVDYYNHRCYH